MHDATNPGTLKVCCSTSCANANNPTDGKWHHFALVIPGDPRGYSSTAQVRMDFNVVGYLSNVLLGDDIHDTLYIGGEPNLGAGSWKIDEFMIYDVALSPEQQCTELLGGVFRGGICECNTSSDDAF
jgi:hypothetical protein